MNGSIEFKLDYLWESLQKKKSIEDGDRLYKTSILYNPQKRLITLLDYETEGPPSEKRSPEKELKEKVKLAF